MQRHASSPMPHGHGFEAATSMKRVGNATDRCARTIVTWPSSSGWRSASRLERDELRQLVEEQDAVVGEASPRPGCGCEPPPTRPDEEIVWCGARNGPLEHEPVAAVRDRRREWMRVTSTASAAVSGGRIDGRRRASIVLPVPGGPCMQQVVAAGRRDLERPG